LGDVFLLASDGLTGMVDDRRLGQLLGSRAEPERKVQALISEANGRGGLDNITAIVARYDFARQCPGVAAPGGSPALAAPVLSL